MSCTLQWPHGTARHLIQIKIIAETRRQPSFADVIYLNAGKVPLPKLFSMWRDITTAPFDCDLELAVLDGEGPHALVFPCRRIVGGWMKLATRERLDVHPTHWRQWDGHPLLDGHGEEDHGSSSGDGA